VVLGLVGGDGRVGHLLLARRADAGHRAVVAPGGLDRVLAPGVGRFDPGVAVLDHQRDRFVGLPGHEHAEVTPERAS